MNVSNGIENLSQVTPSQPAAAPVQAKPGAASQVESSNSNSDTARVSAAGTQVSQSAGASDLRLDKVADIQAALRAGTYQVPASAVAQKVIGALIAPEK